MVAREPPPDNVGQRNAGQEGPNAGLRCLVGSDVHLLEQEARDLEVERTARRLVGWTAALGLVQPRADEALEASDLVTIHLCSTHRGEDHRVVPIGRALEQLGPRQPRDLLRERGRDRKRESRPYVHSATFQ